MQAVTVLSAEWWFQLMVVTFYFSGFCFALVAIELIVCIIAEITGQPSDLPTQTDVHRLFVRVRLFFIRRRIHKERAKNLFNHLTPLP